MFLSAELRRAEYHFATQSYFADVVVEPGTRCGFDRESVERGNPRSRSGHPPRVLPQRVGRAPVAAYIGSQGQGAGQ